VGEREDEGVSDAKTLQGLRKKENEIVYGVNSLQSLAIRPSTQKKITSANIKKTDSET